MESNIGQNKKGGNEMGSNRSAYCLCLPIIAIFIFSLPTFSICGEIRVDGTACTLAEAISSANNDDADGNGCADGGGDDIIMLEQDIILTTALPDITSTVTIEGKGYTIDGNNDQDN